MTFLSSLIGALVAGLVGAAAWVGISHAFSVHLGFMAPIVGVLVAAGARAAIPQGSGLPRGVRVAAGFAMLVTIVAANLGGIWLYLQTHRTSSDDLAIARFARDTLVIWAGQGRDLDWEEIDFDVVSELPLLLEDEDFALRDCFPAEVWQLAEASWRALSAGQREECRNYPGIHCRTDLVSVLAQAVVMERERRGSPLLYPSPEDPQSYLASNGYPADIWKAAASEFDAMDHKDLQEFVTLIRPKWNLSLQIEERMLLVTLLMGLLRPTYVAWMISGFLTAVTIAGRNRCQLEWDAVAGDTIRVTAMVTGGSKAASGDPEPAPTGFVFYDHAKDDDGPSLLPAEPAAEGPASDSRSPASSVGFFMPSAMGSNADAGGTRRDDDATLEAAA